MNKLNRYQVAGIVYVICAYVAMMCLGNGIVNHRADTTMFALFYLTLCVCLARDARKLALEETSHL